MGADGWPHGIPPISQSIIPSTPVYLLRDRSVHRPKFSARIGGGGGLVFEPWTPRAPPTPPWSPFFPQNPTHSADSNSNVLCRIPGHQLALVPPLIIPTTDYVLHVQREPLRCGSGIKKHTRDRPCPSADSEGASVDFTLSAAASCMSRFVNRSTLDYCSFQS